MSAFEPFFAEGEVVKGFGRGSKELGIPTANLSEDVVATLPSSVEPGVYFGLANVDGGVVNKMVLSVGHNPHYHNLKKTMETHILRRFSEDFYGSHLRVIILGYIRPMHSFINTEELISAIRGDIAVAESQLDRPEMHSFIQNAFFYKPIKADLDSSLVKSNGNNNLINGVP